MQISVIFLSRGAGRNVQEGNGFHALWLLNADLCGVPVNLWEMLSSL